MRDARRRASWRGDGRPGAWRGRDGRRVPPALRPLFLPPLLLLFSFRLVPGPVERLPQPCARILVDAFFRIGGLPARALAGRATQRVDAACLRAEQPGPAGRPDDGKVLAAHAAFGRAVAAPAARAAARALLFCSGPSARGRAVPDAPVGRCKLLAALLAAHAQHLGGLPVGLGRAALAKGWAGTGAAARHNVAAAQPACPQPLQQFALRGPYKTRRAAAQPACSRPWAGCNMEGGGRGATPPLRPASLIAWN